MNKGNWTFVMDFTQLRLINGNKVASFVTNPVQPDAFTFLTLFGSTSEYLRTLKTQPYKLDKDGRPTLGGQNTPWSGRNQCMTAKFITNGYDIVYMYNIENCDT